MGDSHQASVVVTGAFCANDSEPFRVVSTPNRHSKRNRQATQPQTAQTGQFPSDLPLRTRSFCSTKKVRSKYSTGLRAIQIRVHPKNYISLCIDVLASERYNTRRETQNCTGSASLCRSRGIQQFQRGLKRTDPMKLGTETEKGTQGAKLITRKDMAHRREILTLNGSESKLTAMRTKLCRFEPSEPPRSRGGAGCIFS